MILFPEKVIGRWLVLFSSGVILMVVLGGLVRLSGSGLSIVEWRVVTGVVPPLNERDWENEFQKYRRSPQYRKVNAGLSLKNFKFIYWMEYLHRLWGRITGLLFVVPFFIFFLKRLIPFKKTGVFWIIAGLILLEAWMGWWMVQSGLIDKPAVSHYRLAIHFLVALLILGISLWKGFQYLSLPETVADFTDRKSGRGLALPLLILVVLQMAWGALTAGLKAGHVSTTFPKLAGQWIPVDLLWSAHLAAMNFLENPFLVHFIHRWLAFVVLSLALGVFWILRHERDGSLKKSLWILLGLLGAQLLSGVGLILFSVPWMLGSLHQLLGLLIFVVVLKIHFNLRH